MRITRYLAASLIAVSSLASACSAVCAVEDSEVIDARGEQGAVKVPLLAATDDGKQYRLADATVQLAGDAVDAPSVTLSSDEAAEATTLSSDVALGTYTVTLDSGWQLERLDGDTWNAVDAELVSETAQTVTVENDSPLVIAFAFSVAGTTVTTGVGQMNIEISVTEAAAAQ